MPDVTVHDSKDERESRAGEQTRVNLLILRNTVRVDDALINASEVICLEVRGRISMSLPESWIIHVVVIIDGDRSRLPSILEVIDLLFDVVHALPWDPSIQTDHGQVTASFHQCFAEHFFLIQGQAPIADHRPSSILVLSNLAQELANLDVTPPQHGGPLFDSLINLLKTFIAGVRVPLGDSINGGLEIIAQLRKFIRKATPNGHDVEDRFSYWLTRLWVDDRLINVQIPHKRVTSTQTIQHAGEEDLLRNGNDTTYVLEKFLVVILHSLQFDIIRIEKTRLHISSVVGGSIEFQLLGLCLEIDIILVFHQHVTFFLKFRNLLLQSLCGFHVNL
mmetsp:Transcript_2741/g.5432  ORF Transcript_2741/g.5432 Transcript_2741/m.5432 type:complete len:334 (+) Transcript_2741:1320-2321(+)